MGFPFEVPRKSAYDLALDLSFRFVRIFDEIVENDYKNQPLQCRVGIAYDKVEAYFSDAGTRTYDLFGRAVILASRYEDLRRSFLPRNCDSISLLFRKRFSKTFPYPIKTS